MQKHTTINSLPGASNLKARRLYAALKSHIQEAECTICKFYERYGVLLIHGDLVDHLRDINDGTWTVMDLQRIKNAGLIEIEQISARQYRVTIDEFVPEEAAVS